MRLRWVALLSAILFLSILPAFSVAEDEAGISERKVQYALSDADIFMRTLDDTMREAIVRDVLSENDEILLARMLYGEDRENPMYMRAAIIWCVYNRVDASNKPISEIVTPAIFPGYMSGNPVQKWAVDLCWSRMVLRM